MIICRAIEGYCSLGDRAIEILGDVGASFYKTVTYSSRVFDPDKYNPCHSEIVTGTAAIALGLEIVYGSISGLAAERVNYPPTILPTLSRMRSCFLCTMGFSLAITGAAQVFHAYSQSCNPIQPNS